MRYLLCLYRPPDIKYYPQHHTSRDNPSSIYKAIDWQTEVLRAGRQAADKVVVGERELNFSLDLFKNDIRDRSRHVHGHQQLITLHFSCVVD